MVPSGRNTNYWTILLENLSPLGRTHLNEIDNNFFDELDKIDPQTTLTMSFITLL